MTGAVPRSRAADNRVSSFNGNRPAGGIDAISERGQIGEVGELLRQKLRLNVGIGIAIGNSEGNTLMDVERNGYIFDGWYQDANFQTPANKNEAGDYIYQNSKTYYAKWIELKSDAISMEYGSTQTLPTIEGVTLSNWQSSDSTIVSIEDDQLKANKWVKPPSPPQPQRRLAAQGR